MNIPVTPELKNEIKKQLESGKYENPEDLICDILRSKLIDESQHSFITNRQPADQYEWVFNQLHEQIYRGRLKPEEKLPSCNRLSRTMLVSQDSVEKAINLLLKIGYIYERKNEGYFVRYLPFRSSAASFSEVTAPIFSSINDLIEVRAGLEGQGVVLAVERATADDIQAMKEALSTIPARNQDMKAAKNADTDFHLSIAYATHNLVYIDLIKRFYEQMFDEINTIHSMLYDDSGHLEIIEKHHFKILDAIQKRDKEGARRHMLQHIVFIKGFIKKNYK